MHEPCLVNITLSSIEYQVFDETKVLIVYRCCNLHPTGYLQEVRFYKSVADVFEVYVFIDRWGKCGLDVAIKAGSVILCWLSVVLVEVVAEQ